MRRKIKMIISFYKLEQIIKIWMESIKTDKEVWYKTVGSRTEDGWAQTYELSPPSETHPPIDDVRFVFIHAITDSTIKNAKEFKICLDNINNPVFIISDDGLRWADNFVNSSKFYSSHINKLRNMIIDADKTLEDYLREHPKFDMDEYHRASLLEVVFKERDRIEIRFVANNRIFDSKNKLYVGFDTTDDDGCEGNYVFKVTEKRIPIRHVPEYEYIMPIQRCEYTATFHGYYKPTEEEILNATFRWIVSDEIIKQADKESRYT